MHPNRLLVSASTAVFGLAVLALMPASASEIGRRFPSEKTSYIDKETGVPVTVLTTAPANDQRIYQTHPQWTHDGHYIIFRSNRGPGEKPPQQVFAVHEGSGEIIQLTDDPTTMTGTVNISRLGPKLYFLKRDDEVTRLVEYNLEGLFADSASGTSTSKRQADYERVVATLPAGMRESGGFALDARETHAYLGVSGGDVGSHLAPGTKIEPRPEGARMGEGPGGLRSIDLKTGAISVIIDTPFKMGHVQSNYWEPGEIVYCWETGGDAPQRMFTVRADGSGNRPLFEEGPTDWVTHEVVIAKDEVLFNLIGHMDRLRRNPTGIALINLRTNYVDVLGQIDESNTPGGRGPGGFWHCNGSADGRWVAGDTFRGDVWLIDRHDGAHFRLTTDHKMRPDHVHPYFSSDGRRVLIQSGHLSDGAHLDIMVVPIPKAWLERK